MTHCIISDTTPSSLTDRQTDRRCIIKFNKCLQHWQTGNYQPSSTLYSHTVTSSFCPHGCDPVLHWGPQTMQCTPALAVPQTMQCPPWVCLSQTQPQSRRRFVHTAVTLYSTGDLRPCNARPPWLCLSQTQQVNIR